MHDVALLLSDTTNDCVPIISVVGEICDETDTLGLDEILTEFVISDVWVSDCVSCADCEQLEDVEVENVEHVELEGNTVNDDDCDTDIVSDGLAEYEDDELDEGSDVLD